MPELERILLTGFHCDVRDCSVEHRLIEPVDMWSTAHRMEQVSLVAGGWVLRIGRSRRWYCPDHAGRATESNGARLVTSPADRVLA